jgi:hypothetical protein
LNSFGSRCPDGNGIDFASDGNGIEDYINELN